MKVLLVGGGGREHAIARQLIASPQLERLFIAPGNGGTVRLPKSENAPLPATALDELAAFAAGHAIDLTVVGPEAPLVAGIADRFHAAGLRVFGPTQAAAQIEGSKAFAKQFMLHHGIPTGQAVIVDDFDEAMRYLRQIDHVPVVKASGLAAGKGVIVPDSKEGAAEAVRLILLDRHFGDAGATVVLEERLFGHEVSLLAFSDGQTVRMMPAVQDHKRLRDGDRGPNTGGMGAVAPSALMTPALLEEVERTILRPAVQGLAAEGMPFVGVLCADLMLTPKGPQVLEFNCRFGDPVAETLLPLLESDLLEIFDACIAGRLESVAVRWQSKAATTVVMAAPGYPDEYPIGVEIFGVDAAAATGALVFHAGTKLKDHRLLTAGGRVLAITGVGRTVEAAARQAYAGVDKISFGGAQYRTDIGGIAGQGPARRPARSPAKRPTRSPARGRRSSPASRGRSRR